MNRKFVRSTVSLVLAISIAMLSVGLALAAGDFVENFTASSSTVFHTTGTVTMNYADAGATDGKVARLTLPARVKSGPGNGPHLISDETVSYGTYEVRLKTADCTSDPNAGVINGGLFTYFNDGSDLTGDGLADNSEIDFEWLCAQPEVVYVTAWTDYQPSTEAHKKVWRAINMQTGEIIRACYDEVWGECQALSAAESQPATITPIPDYSPHTQYYEYGFTWTSTRITWWIVNPANGQKITLWDYQGPQSRIPQRDSQLMINLWHHSSWTPIDCCASAIKSPTSAKYLYVDWVRFTNAGSSPAPTNTPGPNPTATNTPGPNPTATNTPVPSGNLALNRPASASSIYQGSSYYAPAKAVDGINTTSSRWASTKADLQWLMVDLGTTVNVNRVVIKWWASGVAKAYQIQVSSDGVSWTPIYSTSTNTDTGIDDLVVSGIGRYIRLYTITRLNSKGLNSVQEFEVYGQ